MKEKKQQDVILLDLIPKEFISRLLAITGDQQGALSTFRFFTIKDLMDCARCTILAETYTNCCVGFGVIEGTKSFRPEALVNLLSTLFSYFDEILSTFAKHPIFSNICRLEITKIKVTFCIMCVDRVDNWTLYYVCLWRSKSLPRLFSSNGGSGNTNAKSS